MSTVARGFVLRGWHVLTLMLGFFGTVIAVNVTFVTLALGSFPGEDVRRSYLQGLNYNQTLAERREQAARGWQASAALREAEGGAVVEVVLRDAAGAPLNGLETTGALRWPNAERLDHALTFEGRGYGRYVAPVSALHPGRWMLRARAVDAQGEALDFEAELTWRSQS